MATPPVPPPVPGPSRVVTPAAPAPAPGAVPPPPPPIQADVQKQATIDETPGEEAQVYQNFWQTPFVQDWLPLLTSVVIHLGLLGLGILTYKTVTLIVENTKEPLVIPSEVIVEGDWSGALP